MADFARIRWGSSSGDHLVSGASARVSWGSSQGTHPVAGGVMTVSWGDSAGQHPVVTVAADEPLGEVASAT